MSEISSNPNRDDRNLGAQFTIATWGKHVVVRLKGPDGFKATYYKDPYQEAMLANAIGAYAGAAVLALKYLPVANLATKGALMTLFGVVAGATALACAPAVGLIVKLDRDAEGEVVSKRRKKSASITFRISAEVFERMREDLESPNMRFYSFLFSNCGHEAMRLARENGLPAMEPRAIISPNMVHDWIVNERAARQISAKTAVA